MFLYLVSLLIISLYLLLKYTSPTNRLKELGNKIPGPKSLPIIGNGLELGGATKRIFLYFNSLPKEHGPICRLWLGPKLGVVLSHPPAVELLLGSTKHVKKSFIYETAAHILGRGLVFSAVEVWRPHRKIIAPTFGTQQLLQFLEVFNNQMDIFVNLLSKHQDGPSFDMQQLMTYFAADVICETTMGWKLNIMTDQDLELANAINCVEDTAYRRMFQPWLYPDIIFKLSPLGRLQAKALAIATELPKRMIRQRREEMAFNEDTKDEEKNNGIKTKRTFLDQLLHHAKQRNVLDEVDLLHEVITILVAGHDTTANSLSFTCWLLAKHQDIQDKVVEELRHVFGDTLRDATMQDLNDLKYLEQVLKESLRMFPPVTLFGRQLTEDLYTDEYLIPAGTEVFVNTYMLHRHPEHFPDPERFDPDRFSPENCASRHPYAFIPFSAGPRNCVGYKYAYMEMKVAMAKLLRHFKILPPENPFQDLDLTVKVMLKSNNGVYMRLQPRNF